MATRMVTQLYADKINTPPAPPPPQLLPTVEMRAAEPIPAVQATPESVPPPRPTYPTPAPSPWGQRKPSGFHAMVLGMIAAAAVFGGLAMFGMALVWSRAMSTLACLALIMIGGYLISVGVAYVATAKPEMA